MLRARLLELECCKVTEVWSSNFYIGKVSYCLVEASKRLFKWEGSIQVDKSFWFPLPKCYNLITIGSEASNYGPKFN